MMNYQETKLIAALQIKAGLTPVIWGPPGVGKTAMAHLLTEQVALPLAFFNPSDYEPHEIGGVLAPEGETVRRLFSPDSPLLRATREPVLLCIDELNAQGPSKFPAIARIINERKVGDLHLHPQTRVVCFSNTQAQSLDANDLPLPLLNRVAHIELRYTVPDFQGFLATYGEVDSPERFFANELSSFLDTRPELLEVDPSEIVTTQGAAKQDFVSDIVAKNSTWGSPRAWERAIQFMAQTKRERATAPELSESLSREGSLSATLTDTVQPLGQIALTGIVGPRVSGLYLAMRSSKSKLPSLKEITSNPNTAKLPDTATDALAIASYFPRIAAQDPAIAWVYVNRFSSLVGGDEIVQQLLPVLTRLCSLPKESTSPFYKEATKARLLLTTQRVTKKAAK
jgi:MoxR-like ATPase